MTASDVIMTADRVRPNIVEDDDKLRWISVLEKQIIDHMTRYGECDKSSDEIHHSSVLSLGEEYKDMYIYYVVSMIDLANQDIAMYNNSCSFFNEMFDAWQKKWRRQNLPLTSGAKE